APDAPTTPRVDAPTAAEAAAPARANAPRVDAAPIWTPPTPTLGVPVPVAPSPPVAPAPPRPRVDVRIGRIDVRPVGSARAASPRAAQKPRRTPPTMSLDDYLRRRR
ncbi:MAG: hypothetical protein AAF772_21420, partial [Acidobacteriota bacterium]